MGNKTGKSVPANSVSPGEALVPDVDKWGPQLALAKRNDSQVMLARKAGFIADLRLITKRILSINGTSTWVLDPAAENMKRWDIWCAVLLVFTAYMTPVEVAFMETEIDTGVGRGLFVWNRIIDVSFLLDIFKSFHMKYRDDGGRLVSDLGRIRANYRQGWFILDLVSILPFDTLGIALDSPAFSELKAVRIVRLLRLLKLLRLARGLQVIQRWQNEVSVDFGLLRLTKLFVVVVTMAHWAACVLRMVPGLDGSNGSNWMRNKVNNDGRTVEDSSVSVQYMTALYWSSMTLTTVGYGDVGLMTDAERVVATCLMFVGCGVYAYVTGNIYTIMASFGELNANFEKKLDMLNKFMEETCLPRVDRINLRAFFRYSKHLDQYDRYKDLLSSMSPQLKAATTVVVYGTVVQKFLNNLMPGLAPKLETARPGVIVELNTRGLYEVRMTDAVDAGGEPVVEQATRSCLVLQSDFEYMRQGDVAKDMGRLVAGDEVVLLSPYHTCTVLQINPDSTLMVAFENGGPRNCRVPQFHLRRDANLSGVLQVGQMVEAQSVIPVDEFAHFTSGIAAALQPRAFSPREVIVQQFTIAEGMFLVHKGVVVSNGNLFTKGEFFCREGIVFSGTVYREYRSITFCTIDLVSKKAIEEMLATQQFPAINFWLRRLKGKLAVRTVANMANDFMRHAAGGAWSSSSHAMLQIFPELEEIKERLLQEQRAARETTAVGLGSLAGQKARTGDEHGPSPLERCGSLAGDLWRSAESMAQRSQGAPKTFKQDLAILTTKLEHENRGKQGWLLNPLDPSMKRWDIWCTLLLVYTAYMTPVEVTFIGTEMQTAMGFGLFAWNRVIDFSFLLDIFKSFRTKFVDDNGRLVSDPAKIKHKYVRGWLGIDAVSILPFDSIGMALDTPQYTDLRIVRTVRVVRLLRLLKLLRLARGFRLIRRWQNEVSVDFALLRLGKLFLTMITMAHWAACILRIIPELEHTEAGHTNWMRAQLNNDGRTVEDSGVSVQYMTALYWSSMTLTTVGYGDISLETDAERIFATCLMFVGGGVFAYVIGSICTIMTSFGELDSNFEKKLDMLNKFMAESNLAHPQRVKLRTYFRYSKHLEEYDRHAELLALMSPQLRARTTVALYGAATQQLLDSLMPKQPAVDPRRARAGTILDINANGTFVVEFEPDSSIEQQPARLGLQLEPERLELESEVTLHRLSLKSASSSSSAASSSAASSHSSSACSSSSSSSSSSSTTSSPPRPPLPPPSPPPSSSSSSSSSTTSTSSSSTAAAAAAAATPPPSALDGAEKRSGHNGGEAPVFAVGMQVMVASAYYRCTVLCTNHDGTLCVEFHDGARNHRVPQAHLREPCCRQGVRPGQVVEAKSEIPVDEFAHFTAGIAAAIQPRAFTPREVIVAKDTIAEGMFLVHKGIVASSGLLFTKGEFFCREGIVFSGTVYRQYLSVTYVTVDLVSKKAIEEMLASKQFPAVGYWLRRLRVRLACSHGKAFRRAAQLTPYGTARTDD
jgi:voltage-gated potassium channel Kch